MKIIKPAYKNFNIKKRLMISNILMIAIPVLISAVIGGAGLMLIWNAAVNGTVLGFESSEDFYDRASGTAKIAEEIILDDSEKSREHNENKLDYILKSNMISITVYEDNEAFYKKGNDSLSVPDSIFDAAESLGNECTIVQGEYCLYAHNFNDDGHNYKMLLAAKTYEPSYTALKVCIAVLVLILAATVILSVYFTNRFLTNFVFRKIEEPLEALEYGVAQIRDGNLNYRINYSEKTEFLPVCEAFNEMAVRLKNSVDTALKNEQSQKELLAGISHDIRSPLTSIQAYVEGLLDGVADTHEKQKKYLLTVKRKSESISNMVSQIFVFSKMQLDDYPTELVMTDIKTELEKIIQPLKDEYSQKGLQINTNIQSAELPLDSQLLNRICLNIVSNSLKYNNAPNPELDIYSETIHDGYILHFADNGPGADEQSLDKLFDIFYRSDPARNDPEKGSGLGLAIVSGAAKRMNASVKARNVPGGGLDIIIAFSKEDSNE